MNHKMKIMNKTTITKWEILSRVLLILFAAVFAYYAKDGTKQILSTLGLTIAFGISIFLHKHFFPLFMGAILCWLIASTQELYSAKYTYLESTKLFWSLGNLLLPLGIADFLYKLKYKYKIVEHEDS